MAPELHPSPSLVSTSFQARFRLVSSSLEASAFSVSRSPRGRPPYSKLTVPPLFEPSHLSKAAWLSTTSMPAAMAEWELPQSWAQLIW